MTPGRVASAPVWLAAALALAACGESRKPACPQASILAEAASVTRFRDGPGRDLTDTTGTGEIIRVGVECNYGRSGVDVDLRIAIAGTRGPVDRTRRLDLDYFVAVLDPSREIVAKEVFRIGFRFDDNRTRLTQIEELAPHIPLRELRLGPAYELMVGFQLSEDELAWNRQRRRN